MKKKVKKENDLGLNRVLEINLKKLNNLKNTGKTKQECYLKLTKIFVDKYYENAQ